jgi:hypothetical protein
VSLSANRTRVIKEQKNQNGKLNEVNKSLWLRTKKNAKINDFSCIEIEGTLQSPKDNLFNLSNAL